MANKMIVKSGLDLQKNLLYNTGFEVVTSLPTADTEGQIVMYDSKLYVCKKKSDDTLIWVEVGSNIKTLKQATKPTEADLTTNNIGVDEIFVWQDTSKNKSYIYQNVGGTPRICGTENEYISVEKSVTLSAGITTTLTFTQIDSNLSHVSGVTTLFGGSVIMLGIEIDNENKQIKVVSNIDLTDVTLIVYGY